MPEACEECKAAKRHAYSDATTPGFFHTGCERHSGLRAFRSFRIEPDAGARNTEHHKKIVRVTPIPGTRSGNLCRLECGHVVRTFGPLAAAEGVVLCTQCRDKAIQQ